MKESGYSGILLGKREQGIVTGREVGHVYQTEVAPSLLRASLELEKLDEKRKLKHKEFISGLLNCLY